MPRSISSVRLAQADRRAARYAGLVNAVLRRVTQSRAAHRPRRCLARHAGLAARALDRSTYGAETARAIAAANGHEPALDLTVKGDAERWAERLRGRVLPTGTVRTLAHGAISLLPGFSEGAWWVQDAAAALPARSVRRRRAALRSPICARRPAARPRSWRMPARASPRSTARRRGSRGCARILRGLRSRPRPSPPTCWNGRPDRSTPCCSMRPARPPARSAAIPTCPGSRAKPTSPRSIALQQQLLDRAVDLLKPGGTLIYCVCSLEPEEGEQQIAALLARDPRARAAGRSRRRRVRPRRVHHRRRRPAHAAVPTCRIPIRAGAASTASTPRGLLRKAG